jgi:hypothetical protein
MSAWTSTSAFSRRGGNLSITNGSLTVEFDRTKFSKVFSSKIGAFSLGEKDVNQYRNKAIESFSSLFFVNSVYLDQRIIDPNLDGSFTVLAHGAISQKRSTENCSAVGMTCSEGTNHVSCPRGKCVSGRVYRVEEEKSDGTIRISPNKWRYESPSESYYILQENGTLKLRGNRLKTSRCTNILIPPNSYLKGDFLNYLPGIIIIGGESSKGRFISEGIKQSSYYNPDNLPVESFIYSGLQELGQPWYDLALSEIEESRGLYENDKDFLGDVYERLSSLFRKAIQVTPSSFTQGRVSTYSKELSRPVYSRLPGTSGAYSSIDSEETPAKWVTSGTDELLTDSKSKIGNFYRNYLDPDTCYPLSLDWLAQHVGLFGGLWDTTWPVSVKRTLIKNAFGWWDREVDGVNHKSKILQEPPFTTSSLWTTEEVNQNIDFSKIERFTVSSSNNTISLVGKFRTTTVNTISSTGVSSLTAGFTNDPKFSSSDWNGLMESKGGALMIAFFVSVFNLKSHVPSELEVIDLDQGQFKPKSGLRSLEVNAPPLLPFKREVCQCGDYSDLRVGNFKNQLVVGFSAICEPLDAKTLIFRVPYYYNRNGRSWSKVEYIVKNWLPSNLNSKVQYPYLSADLWAVGDAFFEPDYIEV